MCMHSPSKSRKTNDIPGVELKSHNRGMGKYACVDKVKAVAQIPVGYCQQSGRVDRDTDWR